MNIFEDRLLLVEGKDEVNLFGKLIKTCLNDDKPGIQVIEVGGKYTFGRNLETLKTIALTRPSLRSIGVVRDADTSAVDSFKSNLRQRCPDWVYTTIGSRRVFRCESVDWHLHRTRRQRIRHH